MTNEIYVWILFTDLGPYEPKRFRGVYTDRQTLLEAVQELAGKSHINNQSESYICFSNHLAVRRKVHNNASEGAKEHRYETF